MSNQLVKKNPAEGYQNVFPKTWIDAIKDKESGVSLQEILQGFNMYFLSYNGSRALTRCKVPSILRKEGLWITYVLYDHTVVTEWYNSDQIDDNSWSMDSNWRVASNNLVGDISVSSDGYWVINGEKTESKAQGEQGVTPLLRVGANNKLQVSYNAGKVWKDISDYIVPRFKWNQGVGTTAGTIQISMDLGKTWTNLSNEITNNLRISRYIGTNESLPTSGIAEGTIYMKGPYYNESDTSNTNPIYRMWVYAWKGNTLAWQDNGEFTSISARVVQERGNSTTEVMSQDAVTKELTKLEDEVSQLGQGLGISKLRNGSIGNSANLTDVTTEVMPSFGMNEVYISIRRKNLDGYKYVISVCSTDNANDLHKLVMRSELSGPVHTPTILNENVAALHDLPNTMGVMFSIREQSISDSSVINPLRTTDFSKDDIVINGLTPTDIITRRLIENNTNRVVALETSKQTPTKISVSGNNDIYVSGSLQITSLLVGHIYRVYIDANVDMSGVTVTGAVRFEIKVGATSKYKVAIGESLPQYVDVFIDESDSGNLYIGGRCTLGTDINAYVQDFTSTLPLIRNERIKSASSVTNWVYGKFIGADGTLQDSVNWKKSNPIRLLKGQTIFVTTGETSGITNARWKIIETDQNESFYDFIAGTRTPHGSVETVSYTAPKDMYVICQTTNTISEGMIIGSAMVLTYQSSNIVELNDVKKTEQRFLQLSRTVKGGSLDNIRKNLILAHFSDLHENTDNLNHIIQYCDYWGQYIDDILSTGDNVANAYNQTSDAQYAELWEYTLAQKVLNCIGNHDTARFADGAYDWTYYVGEQAYSRYFAPYISQWGVTHDGNNAHCYYYKDYTSQKVRLIVIDVMGWDADELSWFESVLASAGDLQVLVAAHDTGVLNTMQSTFTSLIGYSSSLIAADALNAVDLFINNGGTFICWLAGHTHKDYIGTVNEHPNQLAIVISTANGTRGQTQFDNIERTADTKSFDLFNIVSIDTYDKMITMFRVGADLDMFQRHIGAISVNYNSKTIIYND